MENNYNDPTADSENETPPNTFTYYKDQQKNIHNPDGFEEMTVENNQKNSFTFLSCLFNKTPDVIPDDSENESDTTTTEQPFHTKYNYNTESFTDDWTDKCIDGNHCCSFTTHDKNGNFGSCLVNSALDLLGCVPCCLKAFIDTHIERNK